MYFSHRSRTGIRNSLAPVGVVNLVYQAACISGLEMLPPFRVQYLDAFSIQWTDFPFTDQLEIGSRLCALVAFSKTFDTQEFPVLGSDAMFEIHSESSVVTIRAFDVVGRSVRTGISWETDTRMGGVGRMGGVRMVDVGDFFLGTHVKFAEGVLVM